jgi:uncharacterized protein
VEESYWHYGLYLISGILAGAVNTLAGGGNMLTFSLLLFLGVPANIANGTNRLGILVQNLLGTLTFSRSGLLDIGLGVRFAIPSVIGAVIGAIIAVDLDVAVLEEIVAVLMILMLPGTIMKPKSNPFFSPEKPTTKKKIIGFVLFLLIGFYGGLIQGGIALIIMIAISHLTHISLLRANAIKMLITLVYTIPAFGIFVYYGQVNWPIAVFLSVGQLIGTWLASDFAIKNPHANKTAKWFLVGMVILSVLQIFDVF